MKADMQDLKFNCKNSGCERVDKYSQAIAHLNECDRAMKACDQGCGLGILKCDMKFHIEK